MASKTTDEEKPLVPGISDGSCNLPVSYSGFNLKPGFDDRKHHCSLDIFPILVEDGSLQGSLKYPEETLHPHDVYSISLFPKERNNNPQCSSQLAFLRFLEAPNQSKDQDFSHAELNFQDCIDLHMDGVDTYSSCVVDINVDKESFQVPESDEKATESLKSEGVVTHLPRVLRRQTSISVGEKLVQLLMNYGSTSPRDKAGGEKIHEVPNNHWKRYKRAASFDSRKIVLMFSILSIFGTLVLIYLTLKVRQQISDITIHA